jgi:hypothetical protein
MSATPSPIRGPDGVDVHFEVSEYRASHPAGYDLVVTRGKPSAKTESGYLWEWELFTRPKSGGEGTHSESGESTTATNARRACYRALYRRVQRQPLLPGLEKHG